MPKPKHVDQQLYVFVGILLSFELPLVLMEKKNQQAHNDRRAQMPVVEKDSLSSPSP